ncbi:MAG: efflux RND transporter periplasmic adaptor subunit, partial [Chitinispirillia bacterium]
MKKKVAISVILVIIAALILFRVFSPKAGTSEGEGFRRGGRGRAARGPVAVETAEIKYGGIEQYKEFIGTIKASYTNVIASKVSGRLSTLSKRVGDRVERNEVVATIEDTEYRHNVEEALAQTKISNATVAEAEAQLAYLTRETERVSELVSKGISSQAELDEYSNKLNSQKTRLELSLAQAKQRDILLKKARTGLAYTRLRAAQPGFVAKRHTDGGALLSGNSPVLTIVGIDTVFVEIPVTERDYPMIKKGLVAQVSVDAIPEKKFIG